MAYVADRLSVVALEERYEACEDVMSSRHFQSIWLLAKGRSTGEVAAMTGRGIRAKNGVALVALATSSCTSRRTMLVPRSVTAIRS